MSITAIILAGGQGSRMGGADKGLQNWRNKCLIEHTLERIAPQVDQVLISCNRNIETYRQWDLPCIEDKQPDFAGPLGGIAACIDSVPTDFTLICPCDTPLLPLDLVMRLQQALIQNDAQIATANDGTRGHFIHALLESQFARTAGAELLDGSGALKHWYKKGRWVEVDFSDQVDAFWNINSLKELSANEPAR